ncbi:MAG: alpha,alpha-trehalase TreA [Saprospiraceae bacterium]|nr:alpha,alpha-trehalase TreA [Saprospiraceae bacterium]
MKQDTTYYSIEQLSPLYEDVQTSGIFPDSKFFTDCVPKSSAGDILKAYEQEKPEAGFDLKAVVEAHFDFPPEPDSGYRSAEKPIRQHLNGLWDVLLRHPDTAQGGTLIPLPHPYIVPGGRFREVYYWDSYFTMLGLQVSGRVDIIQDMVENFSYLIDSLGFIPNGNRTYYLGRSQPPFFAPMVSLLSEIDGEEVLLKYRPQLEKEYNFWMEGELNLSSEAPAHRRVVLLPDGSVLNRYWDDRPGPRPEAYTEDVHVAQEAGGDAAAAYSHIRAAAESGWDFSSRWFRDGQHMTSIQTTDLIPVDLNCLLYFLEKTLLNIYRKLPDRVPADVFKEKARHRKNAILQHCWSEPSGFYFDYHHIDRAHPDAWTLAALFPLFFQIATTDQAEKVAQHVRTKFLQPGGLCTTLRETGQQWDAPNGWAPLQWIAYQGLVNYGHESLAGKIREQWMAVNKKTYSETGKMMEKYNVNDITLKAGGGEYPNQDGFGWTNGVYLKMDESGR